MRIFGFCFDCFNTGLVENKARAFRETGILCRYCDCKEGKLLQVKRKIQQAIEPTTFTYTVSNETWNSGYSSSHSHPKNRPQP